MSATNKVILKLTGVGKVGQMRKAPPRAIGKKPVKHPSKNRCSKRSSNDYKLPDDVSIAKIFEKRRDDTDGACNTWAEYRVRTTAGHMLWIADTEAEYAEPDMVDRFEENRRKREARQEGAVTLKWLQCCATGCRKWRIVTEDEKRKYDAGQEAWYCLDNKDHRKNVCFKPQDRRASWPAVLEQNPEMCNAEADKADRDDEDVTVASLATPAQAAPAAAAAVSSSANEPAAMDVEPDDVEDAKGETASKGGPREEQASGAAPPTPVAARRSLSRAEIISDLERRRDWQRRNMHDHPEAGEDVAAPAPAPAPAAAPLRLQAYKADIEWLAWHPRSMNASAELNTLILNLGLQVEPSLCLLDRLLAVETWLRMESVDSVGLRGRAFACKMLYQFLTMEKNLVGLFRAGHSLEARVAHLENQLGVKPHTPTGYFGYRIEDLMKAFDKLYGR